MSIFDKIKDICVILRHSKNQGKGAAIRTALSYIQENWPDGDMIGIIDCYGQHLPGKKTDQGTADSYNLPGSGKFYIPFSNGDGFNPNL